MSELDETFPYSDDNYRKVIQRVRSIHTVSGALNRTWREYLNFLDNILLSEDVKVDEGICGLEGDSEVTHFHGGDVMEEVRA
ncbi:MAG: hypothetical protein V8R91_03705 [Butyricimonas faecihominis]